MGFRLLGLSLILVLSVYSAQVYVLRRGAVGISLA
jgi:hypothetical protein